MHQRYKYKTSPALLYICYILLIAKGDSLDDRSLFIFYYLVISIMKVSTILTVAAPVVGSHESRSDKINENGVEGINLKDVLSKIEAMIKRTKTDGGS